MCVYGNTSEFSLLGVTFKAHRVILAACSKHFQDLFEAAPLCPSVLVILDGTSSSNMSALLEFMYKGEVHVSQDSLPSFLKAAECLQVGVKKVLGTHVHGYVGNVVTLFLILHRLSVACGLNVIDDASIVAGLKLFTNS